MQGERESEDGPPATLSGRLGSPWRKRRGSAGAARPYVLAATILASAMAFIDGTVVNIALPAIQRDLAADFTVLQWVVN